MGLTLWLIRLFRILQLQAQWLTRVLNVGLTSLPFLYRLLIENIFNQNQRWLYSSVYFMYSELFTMCRPDQCCLSLGCCLFLGCRKDILSHTDRSDRSATGAELLWQNRIALDIFYCFWLRSRTSHQCAFWIRAPFRYESLLPWSNIGAETTLSGTQSLPGQWTWVSKCTVAIQTRILLYLFGFQSLDLSWQQVYEYGAYQ